MLKRLNHLVQAFGFLRISLLVFVLIDALARPLPGTTPDYESSHAMAIMMVAALAPILFMLLLLDAIMTTVYMTSMPVERKPAYRLILIVNLVVAIVFLLYWLPYFRALL